MSEDERIMAEPIFERVQTICSNLTREVIDGKPGIPQASLTRLAELRTDYRTILRLYGNIKAGEPLPKQKVRDLEAKGLSTESVSEDVAFVNYKLADALYSTLNFVDQTNPKRIRDGGMPNIEYVKLGSEANNKLLDFFIQIGQKFKLTEQEELSIFRQLFVNSGLTRELEAKEQYVFTDGCFAALQAYLILSKKEPGWSFRIPTVDQDMGYSVDLIAGTPGGETHYIDIKGRNTTEKVFFAEITTQEELEKARQQVLLAGPSNNIDKNNKLESMYKLHEFVRSLPEKNRAYYIEIPTA